MDRRIFILSFGMAGAIAVGSATAGQHEGHQAGAAAAPSAAQVTDCRQAQPVVTGLLNASLKRLEDARLTNSPVAMRDAADDVQAALVDMRTQLGPCSVMQAAAAPPAAPAMPAAPAAQPGSSPAAPAGADAHAGHATPAAPQAPASRAPAAAPARPSATPQRPVAPAAADSHAGHAMPAAPASRTPSAAAPRPAASASAASDAHGGHATPPASSPPATPSAAGAARATAATPPTSIAELKCPNAVDQRTAPRLLYQGRMYYFCTEASRAEFAKDPAHFVTAPPQAAPPHAH